MNEIIFKAKRKIDDIYSFLNKYDHVPTAHEAKMFLLGSIVGDVELLFMISLFFSAESFVGIILFYLNLIVLLSIFKRVNKLMKSQKQRISESGEEIASNIKNIILATRCACILGIVICIGIVVETVAAVLVVIFLRVRLASWAGSFRRFYW